MSSNREPTREEMISAITKEIARKDLTMWCKIRNEEKYIVTLIDKGWWFMSWAYTDWKPNIFRSYRYDTIGHDPHIGDCLSRIEEKWPQWITYDRPWWVPSIQMYDQLLLSKRTKKRLPLGDQTDELIRFLFLLVKEHAMTKDK